MQATQELLYTHIRPLLKNVPFSWLALLPVALLVDPVLKILTRMRYDSKIRVWRDCHMYTLKKNSCTVTR